MIDAANTQDHPSMSANQDFSDIMAQAVEGSGTGIWERNSVTGEIRYSASWKAILGYGPDELTSCIEDAYTRIHPEDLGYVQAAIQRHFHGEAPQYEAEHRIRCKDGSYKWVLSRGKVIARTETGRPLRMVGTTTDVTATRTLAAQLQQTNALITNLTNEIPGLVFQYRQSPTGESCFPFASERIRDIYELAPGDVAASAAPVLLRIHPRDQETYRAALDHSAATMAPWRVEFRVRLPVRGLRWRELSAHPTREPDGTILWHGLITDITDRKSVEHRLRELARIDDLTKVPNRGYFRDRMAASLARMKAGGAGDSAILMIDIDHFKSINDTHGHNIGDLVLRDFAAALTSELRKTDFAGRLGGEEFGVLLAESGLTEALIFAERLRKKVAKLNVQIDGVTIMFTISIGVAVMTAADKDTDAPLARADIALYNAKKTGRNRIGTANPGPPPRPAITPEAHA
jgi:diguanylate cyclase (GGDEF)-like protein/PAS domain S-box-containing protein